MKASRVLQNSISKLVIGNISSLDPKEKILWTYIEPKLDKSLLEEAKKSRMAYRETSGKYKDVTDREAALRKAHPEEYTTWREKRLSKWKKE